MAHFRRWLSLFLGVGCLVFFARVLRADDPAEFFQAKVLPILTTRCLKCHSHAGGLKGGLALDWKSGWQVGGDSGAAIKPGKPAESLLIQAIKREGLQMPPAESLRADEIAILVEWIEKGAFDPRTTQPQTATLSTDWWSLRPLARPTIPDQPAAESPIDAFVLAKLSKQGLSPNPLAAKRALLRRLSFDLLGLPPSPEELAAWEAETSPDGYERLVDRLLASPHVGERAARRWMDVIHFAETNGFEHDTARPHAWRYRDYLLSAFNRDITWPEFIREQLAADACFPDQPQKFSALGFLGAGPYDSSTATTAPKTFDYLDRDDLVTQVMAAFASATINCARCHDHKFDPISQVDYYALQAVFAGVTKGDLLFDADPQHGPQRIRWRKLQGAAERNDADVVLAEDFAPLVQAWERAHRDSVAAWSAAEVLDLSTEQGSELKKQVDGSFRAEGKRPDVETYHFTIRTELAELAAVKLEVLSDPSLPHQGPGRQDNGNLHLSEFEAAVSVGNGPWERLKFATATADFNQEGWGIQRAIDGDPKTAWGIYPQVGQTHEAVFAFGQPLKMTAETKLKISLKQLHGTGHLIGRPRLSVSQRSSTVGAIPAAIAEILRREPAERTRAAQTLLAAHVLRQHAATELRKLPPPEKVFAAAAAVERDGKLAQLPQPKKVHLLARGNIDRPQEEIAPGSLAAISALPGRFGKTDATDPERRQALADWLAHPQNPLTWRSIVNRAWHDHFGRGICDTPSDLGRMGGSPSHPELIDWLACEFRERGASWKDLQRWLVTSAAYRRSSVIRPELAAADADNRWLARMPIQRLDAETFRDAILATTGELNRQIGGPSVQQFRTSPGPQATPKVDYTAHDWSTATAARRSVYRFHWRGIPDPFLEALDFPDASLLQPTRPFSVSPLQSLAILNDDFVLHHAQRMAAKIEAETAEPHRQIAILTQRLFQREPTPNEQHLLTELAAKHRLIAVVRVLFNSNEFLFCD